MIKREKDFIKKEGAQEKPKKQYKTPQLIVYGTVKHLTDAKSPGLVDGKNSRPL